MTIIAWDGHTLVADKQADNGGISRTVTKIHRLGDGSLFGCTDILAFGLQMKAWLEGSLKEFPAAQQDKDDWAPCIVITPTKEILLYERTPYPFRVEDAFIAIGSGRDFATAALYLGKTAVEAVELTKLLCTTCGGGTDILTL